MKTKIEKPIKLTRKTITLQELGKQSETTAWVYKDLLAFHKVNKVWTLTHIPTGYLIAHCQVKYKYIRVIINEIKDLANWETDSNHTMVARLLMGNPSNLQKIREAIEKHEW